LPDLIQKGPSLIKTRTFFIFGRLRKKFICGVIRFLAARSTKAYAVASKKIESLASEAFYKAAGIFSEQIISSTYTCFKSC